MDPDRQKHSQILETGGKMRSNCISRLAAAASAALLISCSCVDKYPDPSDGTIIYPNPECGLVDMRDIRKRIRYKEVEISRPMRLGKLDLRFFQHIDESYQFFYNEDGQPVKSIRYDGEVQDGRKLSARLYSYDNSRLSRITCFAYRRNYPGRTKYPVRRIEYAFDICGRISEIRTFDYPDTATAAKISRYYYDSLWRTDRMEFCCSGDTLIRTYSYRPDGTCLVTQRSFCGEESRWLTDSKTGNFLEQFGEDGRVTYRCVYRNGYLIKEISDDEVFEHKYSAFAGKRSEVWTHDISKDGKWEETITTYIHYRKGRRS